MKEKKQQLKRLLCNGFVLSYNLLHVWRQCDHAIDKEYLKIPIIIGIEALHISRVACYVINSLT